MTDQLALLVDFALAVGCADDEAALTDFGKDGVTVGPLERRIERVVLLRPLLLDCLDLLVDLAIGLLLPLRRWAGRNR